MSSPPPRVRPRPHSDAIGTCVAEVLGLPDGAVNPDALLSELGLESFTAVRLRRRLRSEFGLDLPLTAFLGPATVRTLAPEPAAAGDHGIDESFPLTPIQAAYLVGREPVFPLGGVATFFYYEYDRVPGGDPESDLVVLENAWNGVVRRHPMLRMVIGPDARQRVLPGVAPYRFDCTDLRHHSAPDVDAAVVALRKRCSHQLRPADRWPLFDIRAALLPGGTTRLYVGVDVLALDLGCWFQLMREWGVLVADPGARLPEPEVTFAEFVRRRESDPGERTRRETDAQYWAARAPDLPPGPALPWLRQPAELGVPRFIRQSAELDAGQWAALRQWAAAHGLSPTGVLLAAFALVVNRWGATAPFCLNTTLFDRADATFVDDLPGLEHVVGDFTSTVLVETPELDPVAWTGFADYATAVNRQFWSDLDHRSVSGVEALRGSGALDLNPVHPVVFSSGVGLAGAGDPPTAWLGQEVFGVSQTPQVLLDHIVFDEAGRLRVAWDSVEGALPDGFVAGMRDAHARLLSWLAADQGAWRDRSLGWDPSFLPDVPLEARPFGDAGPLLDDPLRAAALAHPDAAALLTGQDCLSHAGLAACVEATARTLAGLGLGPGDLVAVSAQKVPAQVTALLGVSRSGAGYVPVEPSWPSARVASLCEQAGVRHALVSGDCDVTWPTGVTVHRLAPEGTLDGQPGQLRRARDDELAYAIFTSGSTGRPKGVGVEHRAVRTTLDDLADRFPVRADDRVLALSAFSFDLSVYDIFTVLGAGGALVLPEPARQRDPGHWLDLMAQHRVTVWNTAPALLEMLVEYAEIDPESARDALRCLRLVFLSADWIPVTLPDRIRALVPDALVVSLGGATEGSIWSICFPIGEVVPDWPSIPYGRALSGQSFHILGADGRPSPVGIPGELHIGGSGLAREYVGDPVQTTQRFFVHDILDRRLYRTGDLGRWRHDGTIEFLGRLDRQVKIRGHRIELGEVESVLDRAPGVRKSVAKSVLGPDDRPRLIAFVVPSVVDRPPSDDTLIALLRATLPEFMVPSRFVHLPEFPVTDNGKLDYAALGNPYRRTPPPLPAAPAPVVPVSTAEKPAEAVHPARAGWFGAALATAQQRGLGVTVTITPGVLAPVEALAAAAAWAENLRELAAASGGQVLERLSPGGLLEIDLGPGGTAVELPTHDKRPAPASRYREPAPVPQAEPVPTSRADGPDPEVERAVSAVMSELLQAPVDVTTPFFRLGATSLTLVFAHKRLAADLSPDLAVVDLFARPTVRELALLITQRRGGSRASSAQPEPTAGTGPAGEASPAGEAGLMGEVGPVGEAGSSGLDAVAARRRAARVLAAGVAR